MRTRLFFSLALTLFVSISRSGYTQDQDKKKIVVAIDGAGDFTSIQAAIKSCRAFPDHRITIHLKPGTYREKIEVYNWNTDITLIGEDPLTTVIVFNDYSGKGDINTFTSYTFKVSGNRFRAENITFRNDAGPVGQAVALHSEADQGVFINCRFEGNQDTIYLGGEQSRVYFKDSYVEGTTDFIFGAATALFENCSIKAKKNSYITAASTTQGKDFGFVFRNCSITADSVVTKLYLGRPWRSHAKTLFINCKLDAPIVAEGWHNWNKPEAEHTAFYAEYKSTGSGANAKARVAWSHQLTDEEAKRYTLKNILSGTDGWNPDEN